MKCPKCGAPLEENDRFCRYCGASIHKEQKETDVPPIDPSIYGGMTGGGFRPPFGSFATYGTDASRPPMKWFYFLIYFSLFASAFMNVINALRLFTGTYYINTEYVNYTATLYAQNSGLQLLDFAYAAALLLYAGFILYTRFALASFKRHAPLCLNLTYIVQFVIYAVYALISVFLFDHSANPGFLTEQIVMIFLELAVTAAMILINRIYFEKRKHLFTH